MAWKCSKCGMPNFEDVCALCGSPKPENPEEFIEEVPAEEMVEAAEVEVEAEVAEPAPEPETEVVPEPEVEEPTQAEEVLEPVVAPEPEPIPEADAPAKPEVEAVPEIEPEVAPAPAEEPTEESAEEPAVVAAPIPAEKTETAEAPKEKSNKKAPVIIVICVILVLILGIFAAMRLLDGATPAVTTPSPSPLQTIAPTPSPSPIVEEEVVPSGEPEMETEAPVIESTPTPQPVVTPAPTKAPVVTTQTPKPTAKPVATKTPAPKKNISVKYGYDLYINEAIGFYCAYPYGFVKEANADDALLTLSAPNGSAKMIVYGAKNWHNLTAKQALDRYISYFDGEVSYQDKGNTWYAASVVENGMIHYRKGFVKNGKHYCFDFVCAEADKDYYSPYIEYIEDNFKQY